MQLRNWRDGPEIGPQRPPTPCGSALPVPPDLRDAVSLVFWGHLHSHEHIYT
ncbi:hypothetical protein I79_000161 [Cricetulus griseus]|uniref:Uncharacterized protein n=1 Tax=Cricetulus griseus TaxID=10029 RepID=G3GRL3_CRIGR|nr:hypothetical protein I79_000161 [Cricetulus griseus]